MKNIFIEGEIVHTFLIPAEILRGDICEKKGWGVKVLTDYLAQFYGAERVRHVVSTSRSHNGQLTGTKATFYSGPKATTFMLVEPKGKEREAKVHVVKEEDDLEKDDVLAVIDWRFGPEGIRASRGINKPFADLAITKQRG